MKDVKTWPFCYLPMYWQLPALKTLSSEDQFYKQVIDFFISVLGNVKGDKKYGNNFDGIEENALKRNFLTAISKIITGKILEFV